MRQCRIWPGEDHRGGDAPAARAAVCDRLFWPRLGARHPARLGAGRPHARRPQPRLLYTWRIGRGGFYRPLHPLLLSRARQAAEGPVHLGRCRAITAPQRSGRASPRCQPSMPASGCRSTGSTRFPRTTATATRSAPTRRRSSRPRSRRCVPRWRSWAPSASRPSMSSRSKGPAACWCPQPAGSKRCARPAASSRSCSSPTRSSPVSGARARSSPAPTRTSCPT